MLTSFKKCLNSRGKKIFDLTLDLINIKSNSNTEGVTEIGDYIYNYMRKWPYFQEHPHYLKKYALANDKLNRNNIVALIRGKKKVTPRTVVYLGHMDTVDVGEYGDLKDVACQPEKLMNRLKERKLDQGVRKELESGEWLFGRGSADMKSGIALEIELLKEFIREIEELVGNILLIITVNEEADSRGMLNVAGPVVDFIEAEGLDPIGIINTDYTTREPLADPDTRYIYQGSLGKIIPAVYVVGKGSHIGQVFEGFDVNLFLSNLTMRIDNNMELADRLEEKVTDPPVSLKQTDLKDEYNGQLPYEGFAYYNFLNYKRGSKEIVDIFKDEVVNSFKDSIEKINREYRTYCQLTDIEYSSINIEPLIFTYGELFSLVSKKLTQATIENELNAVIKKCREDNINDVRIHSLKMVKKLWDMSEQDGPSAVIFLVPPFYPPNNPYVGNPKFSQFLDMIEETIDSVIQPGSDYNYTIKPFFPYLSDASFTTYQENERDKRALIDNMPYWGEGWQIDIENLKKLDLPVADIGVYGKGAHKYLERVHLPYSFNTLPGVIKETTLNLLDK